MKILQANAGALTNFEVLDFLRTRGAANDPTRVLVSIAPSEFKVYDYLKQSSARDQTRDNIADFMEKSIKYDLAKAEILNIINIRPFSAVELDPIVEECEGRLGEEGTDKLANLVMEVLAPPPQTQMASEDVDEQQQIEAEDAAAEGVSNEQMETSVLY